MEGGKGWNKINFCSQSLLAQAPQRGVLLFLLGREKCVLNDKRVGNSKHLCNPSTLHPHPVTIIDKVQDDHYSNDQYNQETKQPNDPKLLNH
jgi:hypothetical protein